MHLILLEIFLKLPNSYSMSWTLQINSGPKFDLYFFSWVWISDFIITTHTLIHKPWNNRRNYMNGLHCTLTTVDDTGSNPLLEQIDNIMHNHYLGLGIQSCHSCHGVVYIIKLNTKIITWNVLQNYNQRLFNLGSVLQCYNKLLQKWIQ